MARPKKATTERGLMTVKAGGAVYDGEGGFLPVGATFEPADEDAARLLKARGLAE